MNTELYYKEHCDEVEKLFQNHVENLYISGNSDAGRLASSEAYFWEWLEDVVDELGKMESQKIQTDRQDILNK